jgi:BirA family biotin operon repressor/biotin-[acetyl-CoA-carboxylase] ligase
MAEHAGARAGWGGNAEQPAHPHEHEQQQELQHRHAPARLGAPRLHLRRCDSTNARARELAIAGAPHGTLVTADEQTAGRGRQGRSWLAPAGQCLLCSLVLRGHGDHDSATPATLLPLIAGVALCDAIGAADARLKWPNDVVLPRPGATEADAGDGRDARLAKVAGVLVESRPREGWAVVGVGVNVALRIEQLPEDLRSRAATLNRPKSAVEPLLDELLSALAVRLREPAPRVLEAWRARDALRGREVAWAQGRGTAQGIDDDGRLLVRLPDASVTALSAGDVHLGS